MTDSRKGSVLVVGVGAWHGLGAATAKKFAEGGYPVVVAGRNADKIGEVVARLKDIGVAAGVVGDATRSEDAKRFVDAAEALAPLAVAIHNAGGNEPTPFLEISEEKFTRHWREHTLGGFLTAQAAIPALLRNG